MGAVGVNNYKSNNKTLSHYIKSLENQSDKSTAQPDYLLKKSLQVYFDNPQNTQLHLNEAQSLRFLADLLESKDVMKLIRENAAKTPNAFKSQSEWNQYVSEFAVCLMHEFDPKAECKLSFEKIKEITCKDLTESVKGLISQGQPQRKFVKNMRETMIKKAQTKSSKGPDDSSTTASTSSKLSKKSSKDSSSSSRDNLKKPTSSRSNLSKPSRSSSLELSEEKGKTKKKARKESKKDEHEVNEADEIDAMWDEHIEEEQKEKEMEERAVTSKTLTKSGIHHLRDVQIKRASEILQIKPHIAQALLSRCNWNMDGLLTDYFNDPEKFLKDAGISSENILLPKEKKKKKGVDNKEVIAEGDVTCSICFDEVSNDKATSLDGCKHIFCNQCWKDHFELLIKEGQVDISCMYQDCTEIVPPTIIEIIVSDEVKDKYLRFLSKSFVEHNKQLRWCPAPGCEHAITEATTECLARVATCLCGNRICWECSKEAHPPVTCKMVDEFELEAKKDEENLGYMVKNSLDADTLKWMFENTKQCPFCSVSVQKNDGCYCMTCGGCHKQWCWLCAEPWDTHSDHFRCTKYNADRSELKDKPAHQDDDTYKKRLQLQKLAHFYKLFYEQTNNINLENSQQIKLLDSDKLKKLQEEINSLDITFFMKGRLQVKKCRETLKYSYVHTYFHGGKAETLQYFQENLEICIEKLAQSLARPPEKISPPEIRKFTKVAENALESLLQYIKGEEMGKQG